MKENRFQLPTLNEDGDPSGIFFGDRFARFVSGGRGYDKNCAVVIESDDYDILMDLERTFAEQRASCEISEASFYTDRKGYDYKLKRHELYVLDGIPYDVIYSEIILEYDEDEEKLCSSEKYYRECWFDISRAFHGDVAKLEDTIVRLYEDFDEDTPRLRHLLKLRKLMINSEALKRQEELLPDIIAFNDALTEALREMFDKAHFAWEQLSQLNASSRRNLKSLSIKAEFGDYPKLHPVQDDKREMLWAALCDSELNPLHDFGLSLRTLVFPHDLTMSFESLIGMDCPPPNWNEGLDQELTKDLHLTSAFHNVFDHMIFAITDIIYVRDFIEEMEVEFSDA